jgi:hypothetical protein
VGPGLLPDELEEDATWAPASRPVSGQHATIRLTVKRLGENGYDPGLAQDREHVFEQDHIGFL